MYKKLISFFAPLSLMPILMFATHTMTDAALARLPSPEVMLAAFAVAKSLSHVLIAPTLVHRQVTVAMVESQDSYRVVRDVLRVLSGLVFLVMVIIAFTPISDWVFGRVMGLGSGAVFGVVRNGFRFMVLLPLFSYVRNARQGIAIRLGRTRLLPAVSAVRVLFATAVLLIAVRTEFASGMAVAALVWVGGMGLEGIILSVLIALPHGSCFRATRHITRRSGTSRDDALLTHEVVSRFYLPLIAMPALGMLILPSINANLARLPTAETTIASFAVAHGLAMLFASPTLLLYQTVLAYYRRGSEENRRIRKFCLMVGGGLSAVVLLLAVTPLGGWFAVTVMGLSPGLAGLMVAALGVFALMPLVSSWRDYSWGVLMHHRRSKVIGLGRACNLAAVWVGMALAVILRPVWAGVVPAAAVGAAAFLAGEAVEALVAARGVQQCCGDVSPAPAGSIASTTSTGSAGGGADPS